MKLKWEVQRKIAEDKIASTTIHHFHCFPRLVCAQNANVLIQESFPAPGPGRGWGAWGRGLQGPPSCSLLPRGTGGRCPSWGSLQVYRSQASRGRQKSEPNAWGPRAGHLTQLRRVGVCLHGEFRPPPSVVQMWGLWKLWAPTDRKGHQPIARPSVLQAGVLCTKVGSPGGSLGWGQAGGRVWNRGRGQVGVGLEEVGRSWGRAQREGRVRAVGGAGEQARPMGEAEDSAPQGWG